MHRDTVTRSWGPLSWHSSAAITSCFNMILHVARVCTQFLEAENVPVLPWPIYSPGMSPIKHVWDALDQHVQQRAPVHANIKQHSHCSEVGQHSTINSLISSMRRRCFGLHDANGRHTRHWLVLIHDPTLFLRYLWPTDAYLYSQSCEIHRLGPSEFISIDSFPYMNCNSVKSLKLLHLYFCSVYVDFPAHTPQ